jgi:hypothetical protein
VRISSATTDLFQVASNVDALRFVPIGLKDIIPLAVSMLLPFVPVGAAGRTGGRDLGGRQEPAVLTTDTR